MMITQLELFHLLEIQSFFDPSHRQFPFRLFSMLIYQPWHPFIKLPIEHEMMIKHLNYTNGSQRKFVTFLKIE